MLNCTVLLSQVIPRWSLTVALVHASQSPVVPCPTQYAHLRRSQGRCSLLYLRAVLPWAVLTLPSVVLPSVVSPAVPSPLVVAFAVSLGSVTLGNLRLYIGHKKIVFFRGFCCTHFEAQTLRIHTIRKTIPASEKDAICPNSVLLDSGKTTTFGRTETMNCKEKLYQGVHFASSLSG